MTPVTIRTKNELLDVLRERRSELGITLLTLDDLSGVQGGYSAKALAPTPMKGLGPVSVPALLGAMALGIVEVKIDVDALQAVLMQRRWVPRLRPERPPRRIECVVVQEQTEQPRASDDAEKSECPPNLSILRSGSTRDCERSFSTRLTETSARLRA